MCSTPIRPIVLAVLVGCSSGTGPGPASRDASAPAADSGGGVDRSVGAGGFDAASDGGGPAQVPGADASPDTAAAPDAPTAADGGAAPGGLGPTGYVCPTGETYGSPLPANAAAATFRSGFMEAEGPLWLSSQKVLLVSDFNERNLSEGRIWKYTPASGQWEMFANNVGVNGLALDPEGRIVAASHDMQALTRFDPVTAMRTKVPGSDMFEGKPFNEVNDVVVRSDGNMYFTDPMVQPGAKGRPNSGVQAYYRLSPQGQITRIAIAPVPNGIALSPDGRFLYEAGGHPLRRHAVAVDGSVATDFTVLGDAGSDGMVVDCAGNIYLTAGGGVRVLTPSGQTIGMISVPASGFMTNVAFGGDDHKTLFVTTRNAIHQVRLNIPGFPN
jgi:gluconolactonase